MAAISAGHRRTDEPSRERNSGRKSRAGEGQRDSPRACRQGSAGETAPPQMSGSGESYFTEGLILVLTAS